MNAETESTKSSGSTGERPRSLLRVQVEAWILGVAVIVAFAGGFVFGGLGDEGTGSDPGIEQVPADLGTVAPPLDESQFSGTLPPGHVPIEDPSAATGGAPGVGAPTTTPGEQVSTTTAAPASPTTTTGG